MDSRPTQPVSRWMRLPRIGVALCVFLLACSTGEAGLIDASSPLNAEFSQAQPTLITATGSTSKSAPKVDTLFRLPIQEIPLVACQLGNGSSTSTSHTNSVSSTSDSAPVVLSKPVDAVPPLEARIFFRQDMLSCELFPSGVFRPPRIVSSNA